MCDGRPTFAQDSVKNLRVNLFFFYGAYNNCSCDVAEIYMWLIFRWVVD